MALIYSPGPFPSAEADGSDSGEAQLEDSKIKLGDIDPSRRGIIDDHQRYKGEHQCPHQFDQHGSSRIRRRSLSKNSSVKRLPRRKALQTV